jgi:tetratricopeptide (TPR) repeat protein
MSRSLPIAFSTLLLAACASTAPEQESPPSVPVEAAEIETVERPIPADSVYPLLLAEFALRRRAYDTALSTYMEQAHILQDVGVARHTTHLAQFSRKDRETLEAAQLWLELQPGDVEASNTAATLLARQHRPLEALPHLVVVARSGAQANFPIVLQGFSQLPDRERAELVKQINALSAEFPQDPALLLTQALVHTEFKQFTQAQAKLDALLAVEPYQHQALLLEARIRLASESPEPFAHIEQALSINPEDSLLRLEYARLLTTTDIDAARGQFEILSAQNPRDADLLLSLALINRETGDDLAAKAYLRQVLLIGNRTNEAHYYLGRIAEDGGDSAQAISHYQQVGDSRQYMSANQRLGKILIDTGQLAQSHAWFNAQREAVPARSEQLYNLEADLLRTAGKLPASLEVLNAGLADFPDSTALLYARSMLGDQQGNLALMESDLRSILARDPNNATALNALGYTLADRTNRFDEAYELIARALELDPEEPAILDSMGWVLFRQGEHERAIEYLTRAYAAFPDPEVASHLGEALWVSGQKEQALQIWQEALLKSPGHPLLIKTLVRLGVAEIDLSPGGRPGGD